MRTAPLAALLLCLCSLTCSACSREVQPPAPAASSSASAPVNAPLNTKAAEPAAGPLAIGKPAPDFSAKAHDGTDLKLSALKGKYVVVYFYPKDETPGCTKEACAFRDAWKDLSSTGAVLIGVSSDTLDSHKKFAEHHKLPFHLVSDESGAIAKSFGVPNNAGFLSRQTIVIAPDGNVKKIYRSVDVSNHAAEILGDVKS